MSRSTAAMNDVVEAAEAWSNNWIWSLPLIASTVLGHVAGLEPGT
jgi:hypothetical protein